MSLSKGIVKIRDIVDVNGNFKSYTDIENEFNLFGKSLEYSGIVNSIMS